MWKSQGKFVLGKHRELKMSLANICNKIGWEEGTCSHLHHKQTTKQIENSHKIRKNKVSAKYNNYNCVINPKQLLNS